MSLTFKLLSLAIRTAAKPIGNYIKRQAKEHDGFRRFAVNQAQRVHRIDMRMRLGILHDPEAQQRMHEREQKAADEKKRKEETPTVRTADEQKKHDEQKAKEAQDKAEGKKPEEKSVKVKIRPLSEGRAIELGANFFSEAFIFGVAAGLLIWDAWRSRRKESQRRDDVADRLEKIEGDLEALRAKLDPDLDTLHDLSERTKEAKKREQSRSWWNPLSWGRSADESAAVDENQDDAQSAVHAKVEKAETVRDTKVDDKKHTEPAERADESDARNTAKCAPRVVGTESAGNKRPNEEKKHHVSPEIDAKLESVAASNKSR